MTPAQTELRTLARLAAPIAVAQLGLMSMGLADIAIVGRTDAAELAGSGLGRTLAFTFLFIAFGLLTAIEPLSAQALGAGDRRLAWAAYLAVRREALRWTPLLFATAVGVTFLPIGIEPALRERARWFLLAYAPGFAGAVVFHAGKTFLQVQHDPRPALHASLAANVVNLVVCSVLVRGDAALRAVGLPGVGLPALGALGAGLAMSVASLVLATWVSRAAARHAVTEGDLPVVSAARVRSLGLPTGWQMLAEGGVFSLASLLLGRLGATTSSAHSIALGLASFTFMGALGVSGATAARVGHAVGAGGNAHRTGMLGIGLGAAVMSVGALAFALFPEALVRLFTHDDAVVAAAVPLVRLAAVFQLFDGMQAVAAGALRGASDVHAAFWINVASHWGVGFPISLYLGFVRGYGATGVWWGLTAGLCTVAVWLTARFHRRMRAAAPVPR